MADRQFQKLLDLGEAGTAFELEAADWNRIERSYQAFMKNLDSGKAQVYGVHTGYGSNVLSQRSANHWQQTQTDLLEYLHVGVGPCLPESVVRRALRLQVLKVARGHSAIHPETVRRILRLSGEAELPAVPAHGSLGASGDLIPMAHAISPAFENDAPQGPRDVIGLVNTNAVMASLAIEQWSKVSRLLEEAHDIVALVMRAVGATEDPVSEAVAGLRPPHDGYRQSAEKLRQNLAGLSKVRLSERKWLQPRYSVRCSPMVLGNCLDLLSFARDKILSDALSVADNPVTFTDGSQTVVAHAGLFYAAATATAADLMNDVIGKVCELLDREILILMDPNLSEGLPENLNVQGLGHCKGIHQLTSSLLQQLRALSTPSRNLSFSCEGNNQDIVPCAMSALNQLSAASDIAAQVLRASGFVSLRAYLIRQQAVIPAALHIRRWTEYKNENLKMILKTTKPSEENISLAAS